MKKQPPPKTYGELMERHGLKPRCYGGIGDGWVQIVDDLIKRLIKAGWDRQLGQVKEKHGGLRVYLDGEASVEFGVLVAKAEARAWKTCEICGNPGKLRGTDWVSTKCVNCWKRFRHSISKRTFGEK